MTPQKIRSQLALASDPNTPSSTLESLAKEKSLPYKVSAALLQNPNIPPAAVLSLNPYSAHLLWKNPALPLWLLEDPGFLWKLNPYAVADMVRSPGFSDRMLSLLAAHPQVIVREAIAQQRGLDAGLLYRLANDKEENVRLAVAKNTSATQDLLLPLTIDRSESVSAHAMVRHEKTPIASLCRLAESPVAAIRTLALSCPRFPREHYELLLRAGASRDLSQALPNRTLGYLTPEECLRLAHGGSFAKELLASHPQATDESLLLLLKENAWGTQKALEQRRDLSERVLRQLANCCSYVRLTNPPTTMITFLARHTSSYHRELAAPRLDLPMKELLELLEENDVRVLCKALSNLKLPAEALRKFAAHPKRAVRCAVAKHPNTPRKILAALLGDSVDKVRRSTIKNKNTPQKLIDTYQRAEQQERLRQRERELLQETVFGRQLLVAYKKQ